MNKIWCFLFFVIFGLTTASSQSITKSWEFQSGADTLQSPDAAFSSEDVLNLAQGRFSVTGADVKDTIASGDFIYQNNIVVFFYNQPKDTIRNFRVTDLTESEMVISEGDSQFLFQEKTEMVTEAIPAPLAKEMIPSEGPSF